MTSDGIATATYCVCYYQTYPLEVKKIDDGFPPKIPMKIKRPNFYIGGWKDDTKACIPTVQLDGS